MCDIIGCGIFGNSSIKSKRIGFEWLLSNRWRNLDTVCTRMYKIKTAKGNCFWYFRFAMGFSLIMIVLETTMHFYLFSAFLLQWHRRWTLPQHCKWMFQFGVWCAILLSKLKMWILNAQNLQVHDVQVYKKISLMIQS